MKVLIFLRKVLIPDGKTALSNMKKKTLEVNMVYFVDESQIDVSEIDLDGLLSWLNY